MNIHEAEKLREEWFQSGHIAYEVVTGKTEVYRVDCLNELLEKHKSENEALKNKLEEREEVHANAVASMIQGQAFLNRKLSLALQVIDKLEKSVGFYGDTKSWKDSTDSEHIFDMIHESDLGDHVYDCKTIKTNSQGGKLARSTMKEVAEMKTKIIGQETKDISSKQEPNDTFTSGQEK